MMDIFIDPEQRLRDRARTVAARAGDVAAEKYLVEFYKTTAQATDPYKDWWAFANARQKQADHENDLTIATRRHAEAVAKLNAQLEKMK